MVSTRNTSRSNANPSKMQDPPGDADTRPPGTVEAVQANTNEVEALRLVNQRLIEELEQLTRHMQHPRETQQTQEGHNIPPHEGQHGHGIPRGAEAEAEAESSRARGHEPQLAHAEERNEQCSEDMSGTKSHLTLNQGQKNNHGSRGLGVFNKSSAV